MPSLWSSLATVGEAPESTVLRSTLGAGTSVIALSLLPLAALQPEPRDHDRREQERDHGARDRRPLAELAGDDGALVGHGRHQMGCLGRAAAGHHPDQLLVRER